MYRTAINPTKSYAWDMKNITHDSIISNPHPLSQQSIKYISILAAEMYRYTPTWMSNEWLIKLEYNYKICGLRCFARDICVYITSEKWTRPSQLYDHRRGAPISRTYCRCSGGGEVGGSMGGRQVLEGVSAPPTHTQEDRRQDIGCLTPTH